MFFQSNRTIEPERQSGFTLLELLVVIALLAIVAGVVITAYDGVKGQGRADATKFEMAELRKALLQFRRDSGSNNFPTIGIYDCDNDPSADTNVINPLIDPNLPTEVASLTSAEKVAWCKHPANFWMLFKDPLATGWKADTHRGWNGPYLQRKSGYLGLNGNTVGLTDITSALVWALADPVITDHRDKNTGVEWSISTTSKILKNAGSPYILLDLDTSVARIVSLGDNYIYNGDGPEPCLPPLDPDTSTALDNVLCLLR